MMLPPQAERWGQGMGTQGLATGQRQAQQPQACLGQRQCPSPWRPLDGLGAVRAVSPAQSPQGLTGRTGACSR